MAWEKLLLLRLEIVYTCTKKIFIFTSKWHKNSCSRLIKNCDVTKYLADQIFQRQWKITLVIVILLHFWNFILHNKIISWDFILCILYYKIDKVKISSSKETYFRTQHYTDLQILLKKKKEKIDLTDHSNCSVLSSVYGEILVGNFAS